MTSTDGKKPPLPKYRRIGDVEWLQCPKEMRDVLIRQVSNHNARVRWERIHNRDAYDEKDDCDDPSRKAE